jgi:hypothetical protein
LVTTPVLASKRRARSERGGGSARCLRPATIRAPIGTIRAPIGTIRALGWFMHREEVDELARCVECDSEVAPTDRIFAIGDQSLLCYSCAVRRGGVYDERYDRWATEPVLEAMSSAEAIGR